MGRITLFTADHCIFSIRLRHELEARNLPYTEISVSKYPDRRNGLFVLSRKKTTPQAFFNTRAVGGYDSTLEELKLWDKDKKFATALLKYKAHIETFSSPSNPHLAVPGGGQGEDEQAEPDITAASNATHARLPSERKTVQLNLPGGLQTYTVWELTEALSSIFPISNLHYHLMTYKQSVTGTQATTALAKYFSCEREEAEAIGRDLHAIGMLHHVTYDHDFKDSSKYYYRLQCHQTPHIINTLFLCDGEGSIGEETSKAEVLVERVAGTLQTITLSCLDPDEHKGGIKYKQGCNHPLFGELQEDMCCFQSVSIDNMEPKTLMAFGLNVYSVMLRFAFFKLGLPGKVSHQQDFIKGVKFNIGKTVYSFSEWLGEISGSNVGVDHTGSIGKSLRSSILVSKRPEINPNSRAPLGTGTSTEGSESLSSLESPTVHRAVRVPSQGEAESTPTGRQSLRQSVTRTSRRSSRAASVVDKSKAMDAFGDFRIADYRLYFATHSFWIRSSAIAFFTADGLEKELDTMAAAFCDDDANVSVDEKKKELNLSNIFTIYRKHFGSTSKGRDDSMSGSYAASSVSDLDLAQLVYSIIEGSNKKLHLQKLLSSECRGKLKVNFHQDKWSANAAKKEFKEFKPSIIDANCARF